MDDDDEDFMSDFDPFDLLQEHNLMINRLVKAHQGADKLTQALLKQNQTLIDHLTHTNKRIDSLEQIIHRLNAVK